MATKVYHDESCAIWQGDATQLPVDDDSVACVVSSPPYNANLDYGPEYSDSQDWGDYADLAFGAARELGRVVMPGGRVWLNVAPSIPVDKKTPERINLPALWGSALKFHGFTYRDTVAWTSMRGAGTAWGSWRTPSSPNLRGGWEAILVYYKDTWLRKAPQGQEKYRDPDGEWQNLCTNVWELQPERKRDHPAPFPAELPSRCIRLSTWPGETVLDPFCGWGSTVVAAKKLGRIGIGVDLSVDYCRMSTDRCGQLVIPFLPEQDDLFTSTAAGA